MSARARAGNIRQAGPLGQVVVEMLLILPVFLTIVFTIMELGQLAFWTLMLNHATYECARIGALRDGPDPGGSGLKTVPLQPIMTRIIKGAVVSSRMDHPRVDPQAQLTNYDLVVTGQYAVPLVFPIANIILAKPRGSYRRTIESVVRMPIEQPLSR
ncbi:MAG: pilus assembly protein [Elusimicrobia bacterium]|nr:pilus assembly protein [Elusimicrobiota bacterium]MDE2236380.1 pilus assembly protein [Elusimicrobiota bacterium]MDE2426207.1 pilus assembly protein [Elusimicrobiota bacterium]